MRNSTRLLTLLTLVIAGLFLFGTAYAGNDDPTREGFLDLNSDGINDNMKDSDDDGIPNSLDEHEGQAVGEGTANKGETANAYAYKYSEQLKNEYLIKHLLFEERKGEFMGDVPDEVGTWGDSGEANLNPEWSEESGSTQDVGHKGGK